MPTGVIVRFDPERAFGFIRPDDPISLPVPASGENGNDLFFHVSAIIPHGAPHIGQRVTFACEAGQEGKGPRAVQVRLGRRGLTPAWTKLTVLIVLAVGIALISWQLLGLPGIAAYLLAVNMATPLAFAWDKHLAARDQERFTEFSLLTFCALGGWPIALVAMSKLRHKNRKRSFLVPFGIIVVLECALIALALIVWGSQV